MSLFLNVASIQSTDIFFYFIRTYESSPSVSQYNVMKERRRIEMRWGFLPLQPQHVKHIPLLPHPSDNSNMERNERGSAWFPPCLAPRYRIRLQSWRLMVGIHPSWFLHLCSPHAKAMHMLGRTTRVFQCFVLFCTWFSSVRFPYRKGFS